MNRVIRRQRVRPLASEASLTRTKKRPPKRGHRVESRSKVEFLLHRYSASASRRQTKSNPPDLSELPDPETLRARRVMSRVAVSDALAREIGALAFGSAETWRARA